MLKRSMILVGILSMVGCSGEAMVESPETDAAGLTYEQFLSMVYQEPETGVFIVNGDTPVENEKKLVEFYEQFVAEQNGQKLIVHQVNGADAKWNDTQKLNLTYCVSNKFGTNYQKAIQAMADATAAWQAVANVKYVYKSEYDANCTSSNSAVVFDVNPVNVNGQYLARAFFPDQSRSTRNVLIDNTAFTTSGSPTLAGILRHELGHSLGFRHEHTRPESGTCFEDNNWRALTTYDSDSVMHYPQCNGTAGWGLNLSAKDIDGAALLYGAPGTTTPPPPPTTSGTTTENLNATVAKGSSKNFGPFDVQAGTLFEVVMSGSGDPDLYVRFGAQPTSSSYDCRPYKDGAAETCSLTVPAGQTKAYVMVKGYTASTFTLKVTYTKPTTTTTPPPTGTNPPTEQTTQFAGSVAKSAKKYHGPITVAAGSTFKVVMSGTGDPDLYVRFGSQPTATAFDCRPYQDGAAESCTLQVPAGKSAVYLMVSGYTAATYTLDVTYTAP